jgi:PEP-CTERM motif
LRSSTKNGRADFVDGESDMIKRVILGAALALVATPALASSILYGSDDQNIYTVDTSTGAATLVGGNGLGGFNTDGYGSIIRDLTSSATTLYGARWNSAQSGITGAVATIDQATGLVISSAALSGLVETGLNQGLYSIAYDKSTNTLFGNTARRLYTINPVTGASTLIGSLPTGSMVGLGVNDSTGTLYSINLVTDTNNVTVVTLFTLSKIDASVLSSIALTNQCGCDIAFDPLTNRGYISSNFIDPAGNLTDAGLDLLDPTATTTSYVGSYGASGSPFALNGLAFFSGPVPEPQTWAMMIVGFGLTGVAMRRSKRIAATA